MSRLSRAFLIAAGAVTALSMRAEGLPAQEARWINVSRQSGLAFFVDQGRVDTAGVNQYRIWVRRDYTVHRMMGRAPYNRVVSHVLVDCAENRFMDLERTYYWGDRPQFGGPVVTEAQKWVEANSASLPADLAALGCLVAEGRTVPAVE